MRTLRIGPAAKEIRQACLRAKQRPEPPPFSFVVAAGISHPPVLLARQIVEHCCEEASRWGPADAPAARTASVDVYSYWFGKAYPQASDRQTYLREMMEKAHISRANFRLAHLLLDGTVGQIVVTPNFDDLLARALTLFGLHPVVCDHPQTVERINVESRDVQIVHVHGTYWFYDCANLKEEVDRVSYSTQQESFTMWTRRSTSTWPGRWSTKVSRSARCTGEEAIAAYDEVVRRFGDSSDPPLREQVARALFNKGVRLGTLTRSEEEEVAAYDEVIRRFGDTSDPPLREQVAIALRNKGVRLGTLTRSEEEVADYGAS